MANTFLRKFSSNIGNTATSIGSYTVGSNTGAVVLGLTVSNTTNSELNADIALFNSTSPYYIARRMPIPSEGSLVAAGGDQKLVLQTGDSIQLRTESGYGLDAYMTLMETDSIGITVDPITYSITSNVSSVSEGNTVGYTVTTSNVPDGTVLYWTTSGNVSASDFTGSINSGNVTISNGSATFTRTLILDDIGEGTESANVLLRTGSTSGTIVAYTGNVIVTNIPVAGVIYLSSDTNTTQQSSYTFNGVSLGTAADNRYIIVGFSASVASSNVDVSSVTIGGVSATQLSRARYTTSGENNVTRLSALYMALVPTGTTGTVHITFSIAMGRVSMSVYRAYNLQSAIPQDTTEVSGASGSSYDLSLVGLTRGFIVAQAMLQDQGASFSWLGITERYDDTDIDNAITVSSASANTSVGGSKTVTATITGGSSNYAACSVYLG